MTQRRQSLGSQVWSMLIEYSIQYIPIRFFLFYDSFRKRDDRYIWLYLQLFTIYSTAATNSFRDTLSKLLRSIISCSISHHILFTASSLRPCSIKFWEKGMFFSRLLHTTSIKYHTLAVAICTIPYDIPRLSVMGGYLNLHSVLLFS